jgi:hypothetical protein
MSTDVTTTSIDPHVLADLDAVMKRILDGTPVDAAVSRRIHERAEQVMEEIRQDHGELSEETVNQLLRDFREES